MMLLDDESSIGDTEPIQRQQKIFTNPYFKRPPQSASATSLLKKANSPQIWESEDNGNSKNAHTTSIVNLSSKPIQSVSYTNSLADYIPEYIACHKCSMAYDSHKGHRCDQDQVDSIPAAELDTLLAAYDRRIRELYCLLHTFTAAYLHTMKPDISRLIKNKALNIAVDMIGSNDPVVFEDSYSKLESCAEELNISQMQSSLRDSTSTMLTSLATAAYDKLSILAILPTSTLAMVIRLQSADHDASLLANQLTIWRQRCSMLRVPRALNFDTGSFIARIVDLKAMLNRDNANRYVFAGDECEEVIKKRIDFQSALDMIADRYFGC